MTNRQLGWRLLPAVGVPVSGGTVGWYWSGDAAGSTVLNGQVDYSPTYGGRFPEDIVLHPNNVAVTAVPEGDR